MQGTRLNGRNKRIIILIVSIALLVLMLVFDRVTKDYFYNYFTNISSNNDRKNIVGEFFFFTLAKNTGAAWSFLSDSSWSQLFFKIITIIALIVMVFVFIYALKNNSAWLQITIAIMFSGAMGNFIDRIVNGFVIDFIGLDFGNYIFPIFNIADICLTVGTIMAIFYLLFLDKNALFKKNGKSSDK